MLKHELAAGKVSTRNQVNRAMVGGWKGERVGEWEPRRCWVQSLPGRLETRMGPNSRSVPILFQVLSKFQGGKA